MTAAATPSQAKASAAAYQVHAGDPRAERERVLEVWREGGLEGDRTESDTSQRFNWFYLDNPQGQARLSLLLDAAQSLVGTLGVGRRRMFVGQEPVQGGVLVDFVVSPSHRSALPALTLQRKGREHALTSLDLLYGLPGANAIVVCKRLPTQVSFDLLRLARIVRFREYFNRLMPAVLATPLAFIADLLDRFHIGTHLLLQPNTGSWIEQFDASFDELWSRLDKEGLCIGVRDRQFLQWRFGSQPGHQYGIFAVRGKQDGALRMYFVCERSGPALHIKDVLSIGTDSELKQGLLMLSLEARKLGASSVAININAPASVQRTLKRAQFTVRSRKPFFAVMGEAMSAKAAGRTWYVTQADEDV